MIFQADASKRVANIPNIEHRSGSEDITSFGDRLRDIYSEENFEIATLSKLLYFVLT